MAIIRDIEAMGHEIGYHAEPFDVAANLSFQIEPMAVFQMGKKALELAIGHPIVGAASHREATGYNNLTAFLEHYDPKDLGLLYEAYDHSDFNLFQNSYYITDGYEWYWRSYINGRLTYTKKCLCEVLAEGNEKKIYCLTHPNSWYDRHYHRVIY